MRVGSISAGDPKASIADQRGAFSQGEHPKRILPVNQIRSLFDSLRRRRMRDKIPKLGGKVGAGKLKVLIRVPPRLLDGARAGFRAFDFDHSATLQAFHLRHCAIADVGVSGWPAQGRP